MAQYSKIRLTAAGAALLAKMLAGATLSFTRWGLGSGTIATFPDDVPAMTALVDEQLSHPVSEVKKISATQCSITGYISPDQLPIEGFHVREIGIFASDPDIGEILYAVIYAGDACDFLPAAGSGAQYGFPMNAVITVGDMDNVSVVVDLAGAITKQDIQDHEFLQLDPTDTDPAKTKHLSNAQAKGWEDHRNDGANHVTQGQKDMWDGHKNQIGNAHNMTHEQFGYTALDVLGKLKTVDGHGSGVDADTLDGRHASELCEVVQISSRTSGGTWTITGLRANTPMIVTYQSANSDQYCAQFQIASGDIYGGENGFIMLGNNTQGVGILSAILIPTATSVTITITQFHDGITLRAFQ